MARTLHSIMMSFLTSLVAGPLAADIVNMMYPDLELDPVLAIGFSFALCWTVLSLCDLVLYRSKPNASAQRNP
jgi:hypothetical protein